MAALIDTHCHIDLDQFEGDRDAVLERAEEAGVDQLILIAFGPERWESGARLQHRHNRIHLAIGVHPTEANMFSSEIEARIKEIALATRAVAIGETGLDYHWKAETADKQKDAFARQIALAKELGLPFVIHQRDAEADTLDVLRASSPPHRGVMHCFTGDADYMRQCLDLGLHIGFGGALTFRKMKALQQAATEAPLDRVLLETDSPFMTPSPHRGERNEPAYVRFVAEKLASLRDMPLDFIAEITTRNAVELFDLPVHAHHNHES